MYIHLFNVMLTYIHELGTLFRNFDSVLFESGLKSLRIISKSEFATHYNFNESVRYGIMKNKINNLYALQNLEL